MSKGSKTQTASPMTQKIETRKRGKKRKKNCRFTLLLPRSLPCEPPWNRFRRQVMLSLCFLVPSLALAVRQAFAAMELVSGLWSENGWKKIQKMSEILSFYGPVNGCNANKILSKRFSFKSNSKQQLRCQLRFFTRFTITWMRILIMVITW